MKYHTTPVGKLQSARGAVASEVEAIDYTSPGPRQVWEYSTPTQEGLPVL